MSVHKNKVTGKWDAYSYYYDYTGKRKQKHKSGFEKKRDAQEWERQFDLKKDRNLDMSFGVFVEMYMANEEKRVKKSTFLTKQHIVEKKILPYFKDRKLKEITAADVIEWQNEMISFKNGKGKGHSQDYLRTIHAQLSAIFNHAVNLYGLSANPARQAGTMGKQFDKEMKFWTKEEFQRFIEAVANKPRSYYAFEMLYWCGMREGDDDDKIRLNQRKPSKYKGLSRFGPEKNLQRINKFMKERPTFYKKLIQMKENFRFYLRCFYCITKVVILQFNSEKQDRISS